MTDADRLVAAEAARDARQPKVGEMPEDDTRVGPLKAGADGQELSRRGQTGDVIAVKTTEAHHCVDFGSVVMHYWSEEADAEGDTCECGKWYRFKDRIVETQS